MFHIVFLVFLLVSCSSAETSSEEEDEDDTPDEEENLCDNSSVPSYQYLISFHACSTECASPDNHVIYLAGSDDGQSWNLIEEFEPRSGSVPDIVYFDDFLYLFHTSGNEQWAKINACFEVVDSGELEISSDEDTGGFVDPSLIVSGDELHLFYLPGILGQDPAGCSSYPCTKEIHSAVADGTHVESFTQVEGNRAEKTLTSGTFSDPDIVALSDGTYLLYVSSGQSTLVYSGDSLDDTFVSPDGSTSRAVSNNSGGVPGGIEAFEGEVWLYVTSSSSGVEVIRRGISSDGISEISGSSFETVIDSSISDSFLTGTNVSSPSIVAWPPQAWSRTP